MIDHQVLFVDSPGWSTTPADQPWRWVCKVVTASLSIAEHVMAVLLLEMPDVGCNRASVSGYFQQNGALVWSA